VRRFNLTPRWRCNGFFRIVDSNAIRLEVLGLEEGICMKTRNVRACLERSYVRGRFAEERKRYLTDLLDRGWKLNTVIIIAYKLQAFAARVDIRCQGGVTSEQIAAAAESHLEESRHHFSTSNGPEIARRNFIAAAKGLLRFLGQLREPKRIHRFGYLVDAFCGFLEAEDFAPTTISIRRGSVEKFLDWFDARGGVFNTVSIADVDAFIAEAQHQHWARTTLSLHISSLRCFFRFAATKHWCRSLAPAIDAPRIYKDENLPIAPPRNQVKDVINNIGIEKPVDIRDRAVLLMLASYGFRGKEVRDLKLDDLDWPGETIRLYRSKARREQLFPLLPGVGDAILLYLQQVRPETNHRELFLQFRPPFGPLTRPALTGMVRNRFEKAAVKLRRSGPHVFRHACATHLLAEGFSLKEIGDLLGHSSVESTRIYAKVDLKSLRNVAELDLEGIL
jgi:site-specific recombinase XerD